MPPKDKSAPRVIGVPLGTHVTSASTPEENTKFRVGHTELTVLLDEVFNSATRSICIYGRLGSMIIPETGEVVEGLDDQLEDMLDDAFTDEEMASFCRVLPYNTSLLAINISGVCVTDAGVVELCKALKNSRVRLLDLTNTILDDESGLALLELAQSNIHLRTIVVDDTFGMAESIMDEIDMACMNNEAVVPELPVPEPIDPERVRYCVGNFFGMCADGDFCVFGVHGVPAPRRAAEEDSKLKEAAQSKRMFESVAAAAAKSQRELSEYQQRKQQEGGGGDSSDASGHGSPASAGAGDPVKTHTTAATSGTADDVTKQQQQQQQQQALQVVPHEKESFLTALLITKGLCAMVASGTVTWFLLKKFAS